MTKKIFGILITLALMLSLCLTASIPVMAAATWYVDGSVGSSGDGSYGSPFKTIPEAITAASTGDIIIVADVDTSSTTATDYSISSVITVNKSVTIKAAVDTAMAQVVINNSSGNVFDITADNVTIDGFAISCSSRAIYVSGADYCTVMNNNIISSVFGVDMSSANSCTVADNNIGYFTDMGIELSSSNANIVSGNTCENSYVGSNYIVYMESSNANIIIDNTCSGSSTGIAVTSSSDDNTIAGNTVSACTTGIRISDGSNNIISCNETSGSTSGGISIGTSSNNSFLYNTSSSNLLGVQIGSGVDPSEIYFSYNNITGSSYGVYFESAEGTGILDATYNYWSGNSTVCNVPGRIDLPMI
jgi:parallel beta-helix repeat protein